MEGALTGPEERVLNHGKRKPRGRRKALFIWREGCSSARFKKEKVGEQEKSVGLRPKKKDVLACNSFPPGVQSIHKERKVVGKRRGPLEKRRVSLPSRRATGKKEKGSSYHPERGD